nr:uncharacterized protein LOC112795339 [Arachis hypogaea]
MEKMMKHQELANKNHEASLRNLERQIGQLSKQTATERSINALPSDTIPNPKEECKAIQLRSGRTLENEKVNNKKEEAAKEKDQESSKKKEDELQISKKGKTSHDRAFTRIEKGSETLYPFSAISSKKGLPPKLKDPGSFFLPCTICSMPIDKALCNLGSSINLMSLSMMRRLSIEEVKPTWMSLQLADRLLVIPNGVVENLLVKVEKFVFPMDFVILDLDEERSDSIILGRPFLAIERAIIDAEKGEMTLRAHDEQITLNVFKELRPPAENTGCMRIEEKDLDWKEKPKESFINSPLVQKKDIEER